MTSITPDSADPPPPASGRTSSTPPNLDAAPPDSRFGKYITVERLGAGGMGEVWKAWDTALSRWVALKIAKSVDAEDVGRFQREAQLAAVLSHPNIAAIFEIGRTGDRYWIAMQFIEGDTLRRAGARLPLERRVRWVRDAARAVAHAHSQGIIHRDLKPENIMVTGDRVFVMDFGLARRVEAGASLTGSGAVIGTPAYMPPEQARGERTDRRSDVYGLGAVLYEVLSGRPPFTGPNAIAVLGNVIHDDPRPPGSKAPELEAVTLKCLEKDPTRRYPSAAALADDLDRWLAGEPVEAKRPSPWSRASRVIAKRRGLVAMGAVGLAVGVLAGALLLSRASRAGTLEARVAELSAAVSELQAWTRQPSREFASIAAEAQRLRLVLDEFVAAHPERPEGCYLLAQIGDAVGDDAAAKRDAARAREYPPARTLLASLKVRAAAERLRRATPDGPTITTPGDLEALLAAAGTADAEGVTLAAALREAVIDKRRDAAAARLRDAHAKTPSAQFARWIAVWTADWRERCDWLTKALAIAPFWGALYWERGMAQLQLNDVAATIADLNRAHDLGVRAISLFSDRGYAHLHRGIHFATTGRPGEDEWRAAIADETTCIEMGGEAASIRFILGAAHLRLGGVDEAIVQFTRSIALDPTYAQALTQRAAAHRVRRDNDAALRDLLQAVEVVPNWSEARIALGDLYVVLGNMTAAHEQYSAAVKAAPRDPRGHRLRGLVLVQMSTTLRGSNPKEAVTNLGIALEDLEAAAHLAPTDVASQVSLAETRMMRAQFFAEDGRADDAAVERVSALAVYDRVVELAPTRLDLRLSRGAIRLDHANHLRSRGREREATAMAASAEQDYALAVTAAHDLETALIGRAEARRQQHNFTEAVADADEAVRVGNRAFTHVLRLRILVDAIRLVPADRAALRRKAEEAIDGLRGVTLPERLRGEVDEIERRLRGG